MGIALDESRVEDSLGHAYVEHGRLECRNGALLFANAQGALELPAARLAALLLGPGTTVTHGALKLAGECGLTLCCSGADGTRFYGARRGGSAERLLHQARLATHARLRLRTARRMLAMRTGIVPPRNASEAVLRGIEGRWMRDVYSEAAARFGVAWHGRDTGPEADAVNRSLSIANACLYGVCHCAIVSAGYSPALGFLHRGDLRSFVFDVADIYKHETTVPVAFKVGSEGPGRLGTRTRTACREAFRQARLFERLVPDMEDMLRGPGRDA